VPLFAFSKLQRFKSPFTVNPKRLTLSPKFNRVCSFRQFLKIHGIHGIGKFVKNYRNSLPSGRPEVSARKILNFVLI